MSYRVLTEFEGLFAGQPYNHRNSSLGDFVAMHLYEDLVGLGRSTKLVTRVDERSRVLSTANLRQGTRGRRGDGAFGEAVPGVPIVTDPGFRVARGKVATIEIGVEMKILAKAMIKQIDPVTGDLQKQVVHFRAGSGNPISVALVGINHALHAVRYEGERSFPTDGKANRHPIQESAEAERRLVAHAAPVYEEFMILRYAATNEPPFLFSWVDFQRTHADYGAMLIRLSRECDWRF